MLDSPEVELGTFYLSEELESLSSWRIYQGACHLDCQVLDRHSESFPSSWQPHSYYFVVTNTI